MKIGLFVFLGLFSILISCDKDNDANENQLLTSRAWGKPEIVHNPSGYYTLTTCGESYTFTSDGQYKRTNDCNSIVIKGTWTWNKIGKEIKLKTLYNDIPQKTYIITILELSNLILYTKEREEDEPVETHKYWELKYRPRTN